MSEQIIRYIRVYGLPKGQPRPKAFSRGGFTRVYDPATAEGWKGQIALAIRDAGLTNQQPSKAPFRCDLTFHFPRPKGHYGKRKGQDYVKPSSPHWHTAKPDIDNLAKAVMDCISELKTIWHDDSQVVIGEFKKRYINNPPDAGVEIEIVELIEGAKQ